MKSHNQNIMQEISAFHQTIVFLMMKALFNSNAFSYVMSFSLTSNASESNDDISSEFNCAQLEFLLKPIMPALIMNIETQHEISRTILIHPIQTTVIPTIDG